MMEEDSNENIFELQHHHLLRCLEKTTVCDHDDGGECDRDNGDIYIMMKCLSVTKNDHFPLPS